MDNPTQVLQVIAILDLFAAGLIVPQIPPHVRSLGANYLFICTMGALYAGLQLISDNMTGIIAQAKGKKQSLVLAVSLCGVVYVLLGITTPIILFLGLRAILGVFKQTQTLTKSMISDYETDKDKFTKINKRLDTLSTIGMCVAPVVGGNIMEMYPQNGFSIIAFIVGAIFAVNSALLKRLPKETNTKKEKEKAKPANVDLAAKLIVSLKTSITDSLHQFTKLNWTVYWDLFLLRILLSLCMGVYFCNYAVFLKFKHDASPLTLGYITSFVWIVSNFINTFIDIINNHYLDDKDYTIRNYNVFLVMTLSFIGLAVAPNVFLYTVFLVPLMICGTIGRVYTLDTILIRTESSQTRTVIDVANGIRNITGIAAPLLAGLIGHNAGILNIIYVCVLLAAVGTYKSCNIAPLVVGEKSKTQ